MKNVGNSILSRLGDKSKSVFRTIIVFLDKSVGIIDHA